MTTDRPTLIHSANAMRSWTQATRERDETIALVPTMGALHDGHLALVREASKHAHRVVVSIFVNPTQFGPSEDLDRYPRTLKADLAALTQLGCVDAVFAPSPQELYPPGFDMTVTPQRVGELLCGRSRPGHFSGVCTVVMLLFRITLCHVAVFGQKDYQQLQIIRHLVHDLWLDVSIVSCPIVRHPDGLALSSRNQYLAPHQREYASGLYQTLQALTAQVAQGERRTTTLRALGRERLQNLPGAELEYLEIVDASSLTNVSHIARPAVCLLAVRFGETRLIDNCILTPPKASETVQG